MGSTQGLALRVAPGNAGLVSTRDRSLASVRNKPRVKVNHLVDMEIVWFCIGDAYEAANETMVLLQAGHACASVCVPAPRT